jgi:GT2 family glycosyltransferase
LDFVIIDNGSETSTKEILEYHKERLKPTILCLKENIGHGAGLAKGMKYLKENRPNLDYVVFLEDDSIPKSKYLNFLISKIKATDFSMISSAGSIIKLGKRIKIQSNHKDIEDADFALFDGAIARFQDLLRVGFPIQDWFMMFDDFEYCYRIRNAGYKIGVVNNPYVEILHDGWGGGTSYSHLWRSYYQSRNFIHFVRIHFTAFNLIDCIILQSKRLIGGLLAKNGWITTKMRLKGVRAGLLGKKGKSLDLMTLKET